MTWSGKDGKVLRCKMLPSGLDHVTTHMRQPFELEIQGQDREGRVLKKKGLIIDRGNLHTCTQTYTREVMKTLVVALL